MINIERIIIIDRSKLSQESYFLSLMEEALRRNLLVDADIEKIQLECLDLLAYKAKRFHSGESSSIRVEVAENIMNSNFFTIGLWLKTFPNADDAVNALKNSTMLDLYLSGRKIIGTMINATKRKHLLVVKNKLETKNDYYKPTIIDAIKGFFKIYDPDYGAHEIHITADYPLCNSSIDIVGIEFISHYVESIYLENLFCQCFSTDDIHHLLCGYDDRYKDLVFNIFEQVLICSIGCILTEINVVNLRLSNAKIEQLQLNFTNKTNQEIVFKINEAYKKVMSDLSIKNKSLQKYIEKAMPKIISSICNAIKKQTLNKIFIVPKYPNQNTKISFSFGEKMDNYKYRDILNEVVQCSSVSDKISIIKGSVRSLADLEDLIFDAVLNSIEINAVLKLLKESEVAALAKRHPYILVIKKVDVDEQEQIFCSCLHDYILLLPQDVQQRIDKAIDLFTDDDE